MLLTLAIISLLTLILLFAGEKLPSADPEAEARALIWQYDHEEIDPTRQAERDSRLYHELYAILHAPTRQKKQRLPIITLPLFLAATAAAATLWYQQNGQDALKWHRLSTALASDIQQSQIYGAKALKNPTEIQSILKHTEQAHFFPDSAQNHNVLLLYCQALQRHLDRSDKTQLSALANCYSSVSEYAYAEPIYDRLMQLGNPDEQTTLAWAQTKTLAHPNEPIPDNVHNALVKLNAENPNNPITQLFLASSYQQRGEINKAIPLWQHLKNQLPSSNPLYSAVNRALENAQANQQANTTGSTNPSPSNNKPITAPITAHIHIAPEKLQNLPSSAKLYLVAASAGQTMPTAVKILPLQTEQSVELSDADSMRGAKLADTPNLELRLKLSPSGNAMDENAIEVRQKVEQTPVSLSLQ